VNPSLERGYRRLLRAYPRAYRRHRGEEMLATLLEAAPPGRSRPTRDEAADLLAGAARERLGLHAVPNLAAGLRLAAPIALTLAAATSVGGWMLGTGPSPSIGLVLAVAWTVAVAARAIVARVGPAMLALAWLVTLAVNALEIGVPFLAGRLYQLDRGHVAALGFGLVALLGDILPERRPGRVRTAVAVAVACLVGASALFDGVGRVPPPYLSYLDGPVWQPYLWAVPMALLVVGVALAALRRGTAMIWAGALLLPTGMIFGLSAHGEGSWFERWGPAAIVGLPLIDQFVLDALLVVVAVYLAVRRHTAPAGQGPASATVAAGAICLGAAGGLVLWLLLLMVLQGPQPSPADLVMLTLPLLAAAVGMVTASAARPLTLILAITTLGALIYSGQYSFMQLALLATMLVLLLIALATLSGSADRPAGAIAAAGVVTAVVLTGLTRSSDPWSEVLASPRTESAVIPALTLAVVLPTLWWAAVTAVQARRDWIGPLVAAALALAWPLELLLLRSETWVIVLVVGAEVGLLLAARRLVHRPAPVGPDPTT